MKKWEILHKGPYDDIVEVLLSNRGLSDDSAKNSFLRPPDPFALTPGDVGIDSDQLSAAVDRIRSAVKNKESVVVYADYDADGITAGSIMWETLHGMGCPVMPYIPHRVEEGYGLSEKGIDNVFEKYAPSLIVTVDHGISAFDKVAYAKKRGIDVVVTDHHTKPEKLPDCRIVHSSVLCGAGVSWFVSKAVSGKNDPEHLGLAAIGSIADLMPLSGVNRTIVKAGLSAIKNTRRVGLIALLSEAVINRDAVRPYDISHAIAPRLNAMGRLEHALDALRLLCTGNPERAAALSQKLGSTNRERQKITQDTLAHALTRVEQEKLLFVAHESYNQGIIGLVAGKLTEEYYRPSVVLSVGETLSKASARSIPGFNIVEAIRQCRDLLVEVGGHPMAAGFSVETKHLEELKKRLLQIASEKLTDDLLVRVLKADVEIPVDTVTTSLWRELESFEPFGFGNTEPVFVSRGLRVLDARQIGKDKKHLKLKVRASGAVAQPKTWDAIAFGMGDSYADIQASPLIDIAYSIDMNVWNGNSTLQLKIKDIHGTM